MFKLSSLGRLGWRRRNTELVLILLVLLIGKLGLFNVEVAMNPAHGFSASTQIGFVIAALLGHLAIRVWAGAADPFIFPIALLLNLLGIVMIHRLDITAIARATSSELVQPDATSQSLWLLLGILVSTAVLVVVRDHRQLQRFTFTAMFVSLLLLLLPMLPHLGVSVNGARLWIRFMGVSFQPAEAAKILLAIFFAGYLARHHSSMAAIERRWFGIGLPKSRELGPIAAAWALSVLVLISQRDLGTSLLFFGLFVGLLYVATGQRTWLAVGAVMFMAAASLAYLLFGHVRDRVSIWLDPFSHAHDSGYQLVQSLYGFASGGLFGRGLGQGFTWLVPYAKSDFILAAFGEELGYFGLTAIVMLYAVLIQRSLRIAVSARDDFGKLLSTGLALVLALQVFVVLGGISRLIPLTGLTTPFLAAGGSALIANWAMIGLLLRISNTTAKLAVPGGDVA